MSSPATVTEYGKFIDLQNYTATAPEKSGSIYLSGSDAAEKLHTNVGISAAGSVTAVGSFIIGSADMSEADLEKLDGITNGTAAASKALVLDASKDISGIRDMGMRDASGSGDVTFNGSAVLGQNVDLTGDLTAGTITMTGFTVDADGDTALKSLAVVLTPKVVQNSSLPKPVKSFSATNSNDIPLLGNCKIIECISL